MKCGLQQDALFLQSKETRKNLEIPWRSSTLGIYEGSQGSSPVSIGLVQGVHPKIGPE